MELKRISALIFVLPAYVCIILASICGFLIFLLIVVTIILFLPLIIIQDFLIFILDLVNLGGITAGDSFFLIIILAVLLTIFSLVGYALLSIAEKVDPSL
ncbi:MAG: hypothetical protein ACXAEU_22185 [Candidatus Hodarchaeales archaeon]|jgi:hypothetical protein